VVEIVPKPSCKGGFSDGQGHSWVALVGQSWQLSKLLLGKRLKEVLTMTKIALNLKCKGGFGDGQGHSQAGLMGRSQQLVRLFLS